MANAKNGIYAFNKNQRFVNKKAHPVTDGLSQFYKMQQINIATGSGLNKFPSS